MGKRVENPAQGWFNSIFWHDRSDQSEFTQILDLLIDIRMLLLLIAAILVLK